MADNDQRSGSSEKESQGQEGVMDKRGVSRPMAEMPMDSEGDDGGSHDMSREQRLEMLHKHHKNTLWVYWTILLIGVWLLLAPATFGYNKGLVTPGGGREVWLTMSQRITAMTWSDIISGVLLIIFGWRSLRPNRPVSLWICCGVGVWVTLAPVLFWAPTAAAYLNGTITGALLIALTILIPGMPNMIMYMKMGGSMPPGWTYNPSNWPQRWIMIATGFAGWLVSRYLAAFQLGYIESIWDPFFGSGSRQVLNSDMSHMWPISDGALGAVSYTFEFLMGFMGSPARWRTMPWMVAIFGILVIPLGLTHIILVISQPLVVGHWCTMCLLAAAIMLPMIPLEVDEVVAMVQHVVQRVRRGESFWRVFWKGGSAEDSGQEKDSPALMELPEHPWKVFVESIRGMSFPWTLNLCAVLGILLMFVPTIFGVDKPASDVFHFGGALVITVSVIAMGEVVRTARYLDVLLGLGLAILPWVFAPGNIAANLAGVALGGAVVLLCLPMGQQTESYGTWDPYVR
jgi:hypothetical protein